MQLLTGDSVCVSAIRCIYGVVSDQVYLRCRLRQVYLRCYLRSGVVTVLSAIGVFTVLSAAGVFTVSSAIGGHENRLISILSL